MGKPKTRRHAQQHRGVIDGESGAAIVTYTLPLRAPLQKRACILVFTLYRYLADIFELPRDLVIIFSAVRGAVTSLKDRRPNDESCEGD